MRNSRHFILQRKEPERSVRSSGEGGESVSSSPNILPHPMLLQHPHHRFQPTSFLEDSRVDRRICQSAEESIQQA